MKLNRAYLVESILAAYRFHLGLYAIGNRFCMIASDFDICSDSDREPCLSHRARELASNGNFLAPRRLIRVRGSEVLNAIFQRLISNEFLDRVCVSHS